MSYCRWSSDGFQCDLYCYKNTRGEWVTHVALARRPKRVAGHDFSNTLTLMASHALREKQLSDPANRPVPIGLPHDGEDFYDGSRTEFLERLLHLRAVGYLFPDYVLEEVRAEADAVATE